MNVNAESGRVAPMSPEELHLDRRLRHRIRFTREGRYFVLVTLGVGFAAINTGNNLLYLMLGLLLSLIVLSGILSEVVLRRIRLERHLPERAFANSVCLVEVALTNHKTRVPVYSIEVEDAAKGSPTERRCYFLKVAPLSRQVAIYRRTPVRRGWLELSGFRVATRYPFGLFEKWRTIDAPGALLVYPEVVAPTTAPPSTAAHGHERPSAKLGPGMEIVGVRAYREGDEARAIHWRKTAALRQLVVRERERDAAHVVRLPLDNLRPPNAGAEWLSAFERAVSETAGVAAALLSRGSGVQVVCPTSSSAEVAPGQAPDPIWRFLALVEPVDASATVAAVDRRDQPVAARGASA